MPTIEPSTVFADVYLLNHHPYCDERGYFSESYRASWWQERAPEITWLQENRSYSQANVLRGLHYQLEQPQAKLIEVLSGAIFDVVVDLRRSSPTFGRWQGFVLDSKQHQQLFIPAGFAHGFYALSAAEVLYRCSAYYHLASERSVHWNDPELDIHWPLLSSVAPLLSAKDQQAVAFKDADYFA